jgi:hypothetical protein
LLAEKFRKEAEEQKAINEKKLEVNILNENILE